MSRKWRNNNADFPQKPYDLIREMFIALGTMGVLVLVLAAVFSTPDVPALTAKQVAAQDPQLLIQNALDDLSGQDAISTYGPPYSHTAGAAQSFAGISPQQWGGVQIPINSGQVNVLTPLTTVATINPALEAPLKTWDQAAASQQGTWIKNVEASLSKTTIVNGKLILPSGSLDYGPLPTMLDSYLSLAKSGLLEASIDGATGPMPSLNRTKSLLLLQDQPDAAYANQLDMTGDQWGIIKETGNYPGAVWLWFYTLLYQIPPFVNADSADLLVVMTVGIVTLLLIFIPFIPGLRSVPKVIGIYKLIWRRYYRNTARTGGRQS